MRKFRFDPSHTSELPSQPAPSLPVGLPFILDDSFEPVGELNAWLRALPERGCHSRRTWDGYADDLLSWARFLQSRGHAVLDKHRTLVRDVADFRQERLEGGQDGAPGRLGPRAWNRAISAMENFYGWAVEENLVRTRPFRYRSVYVSTGPLAGQTVEKNQARSKTGSRAASIRSLSPDFADLFIEVGLGGALRDGTPDPAFGGRNAARNRAMAALVRSSGLRRQEFSNLLLWEVPQSAPLFGDFVALHVSPQIAKGARERTTWASSAALDAVHDYVALERSFGTTKWRPSNPLYVSEPNSHSGLVNGSRVEWHRLTISQRRRLVSPDGGSALLFRGRAGSTIGENSWRYVFDTAVQRCRRFDSRFPEVTPHTLRHTFAIETLNLLTRAAMSRAEKLAKVAGTDPLLMAILRRNDPLLIVRDMLGHKSVQTTEIYLSLQDPDTILSDAELALLADEGETEDLRWIS